LQVTDDIIKAIPELGDFDIGNATLFLQHTSASITINESWDSDVRPDVSDALDRLAPEDPGRTGLYRHDAEGSDDCPAHIKSTLVGCSLSIPVGKGKLMLGTWQGIWLCEHRNHASSRSIVVTVNGQLRPGSALGAPASAPAAASAASSSSKAAASATSSSSRA
jgi:secondary thiamine-phosphate synthase enzyme